MMRGESFPGQGQGTPIVSGRGVDQSAPGAAPGGDVRPEMSTPFVVNQGGGTPIVSGGGIDQSPSAGGGMLGTPGAPPAPGAPPSPSGAQGAPGVPPGTDPSQPGWTYGSGTPQGQIQTGMSPGQVNTGYINPQQMPVQNVQQGSPYMQRMEDAYYQHAASRLDPRFQQQQAGLEGQLANMGLTRGSEAWNREMQNLSFERNDAYGAASQQAILNSGAEAARLQGMDINAGQFANTAAQQGYQNQITSQQAQNAAGGQQFNQNLQAGQFGNAAQQQSYAQQLAQAQLRNDAMGRQADQSLQGQQIANQFALGTEGNRLQGVNIGNQYDLGIRGNETQRYGYDQSLAGTRYASDQSLRGAQASAGAASAAAAAQAAIGNRSLDMQQQQQNWNQYRQGLALPYEMQNLQMNGMYPTGMPNAPGFSAAPPIPGGNQLAGGLARGAQNQNTWNAAGSLGGSLWNMYQNWG